MCVGKNKLNTHITSQQVFDNKTENITFEQKQHKKYIIHIDIRTAEYHIKYYLPSTASTLRIRRKLWTFSLIKCRARFNSLRMFSRIEKKHTFFSNKFDENLHCTLI